MATAGDDIRDELMAVIEAAPELAREDREHLADVFLEQLNARYDLVPRGAGKRAQPARPVGGPPWGGRWLPYALMFAFLLFALPAAFHMHFPVFLFVAIAVFFIMKRRAWGMRRGWML